MLKFLFLVNKQGQTRLSQYYEYIKLEDRSSLEAEIVRKCLTRNEDQVFKYLVSMFSYILFSLSHFLLILVIPQCSFMEYKNFKVVYRRYASLYFIVGVDSSEVNVLQYKNYLLSNFLLVLVKRNKVDVYVWCVFYHRMSWGY